jgi:uncharacterized protein (DUF2336 family)
LTIQKLALLTFARRGNAVNVGQRLAGELLQRSEFQRVRATEATLGLVERDPRLASDLLTPLLNDSSHDVRAAVVVPLARAYAKTISVEKLVALLRESEVHATHRLVLTGALIEAARAPENREKVDSALDGLAQAASPFVRQAATLAQGLLASGAHGLVFLAALVP